MHEIKVPETMHLFLPGTLDNTKMSNNSRRLPLRHCIASIQKPPRALTLSDKLSEQKNQLLGLLNRLLKTIPWLPIWPKKA
jgi:hypothetical protein